MPTLIRSSRCSAPNARDGRTELNCQSAEKKENSAGVRHAVPEIKGHESFFLTRVLFLITTLAPLLQISAINIPKSEFRIIAVDSCPILLRKCHRQGIGLVTAPLWSRLGDLWDGF